MMNSFLFEIRATALALAFLFLVAWLTDSLPTIGFNSDRESTKEALALVADRLDAKVNRGRYLQVPQSEIKDKDSWGRTVRVEYRQEGVGERIVVRSAGEDGTLGTSDDITADRWLLNANGIGQQAQDGVSDMAENATKGVIKGIKGQWKEMLASKTANDHPPTPAKE